MATPAESKIVTDWLLAEFSIPSLLLIQFENAHPSLHVQALGCMANGPRCHISATDSDEIACFEGTVHIGPWTTQDPDGYTRSLAILKAHGSVDESNVFGTFAPMMKLWDAILHSITPHWAISYLVARHFQFPSNSFYARKLLSLQLHTHISDVITVDMCATRCTPLVIRALNALRVACTAAMPQEEWLTHAAPVLVDRDTWLACARLARAPRHAIPIQSTGQDDADPSCVVFPDGAVVRYPSKCRERIIALYVFTDYFLRLEVVADDMLERIRACLTTGARAHVL
jgi:hypothetical protein